MDQSGLLHPSGVFKERLSPPVDLGNIFLASAYNDGTMPLLTELPNFEDVEHYKYAAPTALVPDGI